MKSDQLSKTAAYIAIKFYGITLTEPYRSLFDRDTLLFYDRLVANLPSPLHKYHTYLKNRWLRKCLMSLDELFLPGDLMHIVTRKYYIASMIEELTSHNYYQMIVLGSGFDHLGKTYAEKGLQCIELDVPRMAHIKQQFLELYNYNNEYLTIYPAHFSGSKFEELLNKIPSLDTQQKTIIVAEGFFDYLTLKELESILADISNHFEKEVILISTVFNLEELSRFRSLVFRSAVYAVGEKLKLHCTIQEFAQILEGLDFGIDELLSGKSMKNDLLNETDTEIPILPGFYLLKAEIKL